MEGEVGFVLRRAQLAVFRDIIETLAPFRLRPTAFSALRVIAANPGLKQQDVGRELGIQGPNLVAMVEELRRKELIVRRVVEGDRRSYALILAPAGRGLLEQAEQAHDSHRARIREALGDCDTTLFLTCLQRLARLRAEPRVQDVASLAAHPTGMQDQEARLRASGTSKRGSKRAGRHGS